MAKLAIDMMEYASDALAQAAYVSSDAETLRAYSESAVKTCGAYALKCVASAGSTGQKLVKSLTPPSDFSRVRQLKFDLRAGRTGQNIRLSLLKQTGMGLSFDGSSSRVDAGSGLDFDGTSPFSFSAWVWHNGGYAAIVSTNHDLNHANPGWSVFFYGGVVYVQLNAGAGYTDNEIQLNINGSVPSSSWHLITVTYDGTRSASGIHVYVDGVDQSLNVGCDTLTQSMASGNHLFIGSCAAESTSFAGQLDEVLIFSRVLSSEEVGMLFNGGAGLYGDMAVAPFSSGLLAGWHFDEGSGNVTEDFAGARDGAITDCAYVTGKIVADDVTVAECIPDVAAAGDFQTYAWDLSGIPDTSKNNVNLFHITILDGQVADTFYLDAFEIAQGQDIFGIV